MERSAKDCQHKHTTRACAGIYIESNFICKHCTSSRRKAKHYTIVVEKLYIKCQLSLWLSLAFRVLFWAVYRPVSPLVEALVGVRWLVMQPHVGLLYLSLMKGECERVWKETFLVYLLRCYLGIWMAALRHTVELKSAQVLSQIRNANINQWQYSTQDRGGVWFDTWLETTFEWSSVRLKFQDDEILRRISQSHMRRPASDIVNHRWPILSTSGCEN